MAITKKFKVSFDVKAVIPTEQEDDLKELIKSLAKRAGDIESSEKLNGFERELLIRALTDGPDGAVAFIVQHATRKGIKEMFEEIGDKRLFKASPATVRVVK